MSAQGRSPGQMLCTSFGTPQAREQGWLGEVAAIETTLAAAAQKLEAMRDLTARRTSIHLGMPHVRPSTGRRSLDP
jgi:hypothetical protein